jgi:transposase
MELRTCPCCGGIAEIEVKPGESQVRCLECDLKIKRPSEDLAAVISAWNRRVRLGMKDQ